MDNRLKELTQRIINDGTHGALLNTVMSAKKYTGILAAVVAAGGLSPMARQLGVSYQAVQQWMGQGYVPLIRVTEIESLYGVPRAELMNPKYAAALAEPNFSDEA
jgi:DNA-binding transcriptional regulator YdaS (Cro superfamily)